MTTTQVFKPTETFLDVDGDPLEDGYIFVGVAASNPESSPIQVYWDRAMTVPATQPIRTKGGYPSNAGVPSRLYIGRNTYSILTKNKNGTTVLSEPSANSPDSSSIIFQRPEAGSVQRDVKDKLLDEPPTPEDFGAVGNGIANDSVPWQAYEAVSPFVYLRDGSSYNLGSYKPVNYIVGNDSQVIANGVTIRFAKERFNAKNSTMATTISETIPTWGFPSGGESTGGQLNLIYGIGEFNGGMHFCTFFGSGLPRHPISLNRCDGFGNGALQHADYGNRNTAIGTISQQWNGTTDPERDQHPWFGPETGGLLPGQPGWDPGLLETKNPGIGAKIAAVVTATDNEQVRGNVGCGRDTLNASVITNYCTTIGYRAGASCYNSWGVTALGNDAFLHGVMMNYSVAAGIECALDWQEGNQVEVYGYKCAEKVIRGSNNTFYGAFAGGRFTDSTGCLFIGQGAGNDLNPTSLPGITVSNKLAIGMASKTLISGDLANNKAGINTTGENLAATLHVAAARNPTISVHTNGDELLLENTSNTGMTIRSSSTGFGSIYVADADAQDVGGLIYNHSTDTWNMRAAGANRIICAAASFVPAVNSSMTLGGPSNRWTVVYADTATINTSDERSKAQISDIPDEVLDAWQDVDYQIYKFKSSVEEKGDAARWHFGVIAQRIKSAFEDRGLDAFEYGILCYDEWNDAYETVHAVVEQVPAVYSEDAAGEESVILEEAYEREVEPAHERLVTPAGNRYGVRYEEALTLESALLRRSQKRLEARIKQLEDLQG